MGKVLAINFCNELNDLKDVYEKSRFIYCNCSKPAYSGNMQLITEKINGILDSDNIPSIIFFVDSPKSLENANGVLQDSISVIDQKISVGNFYSVSICLLTNSSNDTELVEKLRKLDTENEIWNKYVRTAYAFDYRPFYGVSQTSITIKRENVKNAVIYSILAFEEKQIKDVRKKNDRCTVITPSVLKLDEVESDIKNFLQSQVFSQLEKDVNEEHISRTKDYLKRGIGYSHNPMRTSDILRFPAEIIEPLINGRPNYTHKVDLKNSLDSLIDENIRTNANELLGYGNSNLDRILTEIYKEISDDSLTITSLNDLDDFERYKARMQFSSIFNEIINQDLPEPALGADDMLDISELYRKRTNDKLSIIGFYANEYINKHSGNVANNIVKSIVIELNRRNNESKEVAFCRYIENNINIFCPRNNSDYKVNPDEIEKIRSGLFPAMMKIPFSDIDKISDLIKHTLNSHMKKMTKELQDNLWIRDEYLNYIKKNQNNYIMYSQIKPSDKSISNQKQVLLNVYENKKHYTYEKNEFIDEIERNEPYVYYVTNNENLMDTTSCVCLNIDRYNHDISKLQWENKNGEIANKSSV